MKTRRIVSLLVIFLASLNCFSEDDIIVTTEEWAPYNYEINGVITGLSTEIVQRIMQIIGERYAIEIYPAVRAKYFIDNRPKTIFYSLFRTAERENKYKWVGPIVEENIYFYKLKSSDIEIRTLEDTKKVKSIACRRAGLIYDLLVKKGYTNLDLSGTDSQLVYQKLLAQRTELAISDTESGVKYMFGLLNKPNELIEKINFSFFTSKLYIAFSKDIPDNEIARWQAAFDKLRQSGELNQIIRKYQ